jgi:hypothetical protein
VNDSVTGKLDSSVQPAGALDQHPLLAMPCLAVGGALTGPTRRLDRRG